MHGRSLHNLGFCQHVKHVCAGMTSSCSHRCWVPRSWKLNLTVALHTSGSPPVWSKACAASSSNPPMGSLLWTLCTAAATTLCALTSSTRCCPLPQAETVSYTALHHGLAAWLACERARHCSFIKVTNSLFAVDSVYGRSDDAVRFDSFWKVLPIFPSKNEPVSFFHRLSLYLADL